MCVACVCLNAIEEFAGGVSWTLLLLVFCCFFRPIAVIRFDEYAWNLYNKKDTPSDLQKGKQEVALMQGTARQRVQKILRVLLSVATVLFAVLLMVQCIGIYHAGISPDNMGENGLRIHDIYSREIVAERFGKIAWSFYLWLVLLLASVVAGKPQRKENLRAPLENQLAILRKRTDESDETRRLKKQRMGICALAVVVCTLCAVFAGRFLLDMQNFASRDLEPVMRQLVIAVFPWIGVAFAVLMLAEEGNYRLLQKELDIRKTAPKKKPTPETEKSTHMTNVVRLVLMGVAVLLIVMGIENGGMFDVLVKAINICTECIGLG